MPHTAGKKAETESCAFSFFSRSASGRLICGSAQRQQAAGQHACLVLERIQERKVQPYLVLIRSEERLDGRRAIVIYPKKHVFRERSYFLCDDRRQLAAEPMPAQ